MVERPALGCSSETVQLGCSCATRPLAAAARGHCAAQLSFEQHSANLPVAAAATILMEAHYDIDLRSIGAT